MTAVAKELVEILGGLPEDKARTVVNFARFLQQQAGDREWERILAATRAYPKLDTFVADALREGPAELLATSEL
jgi:hypothetical protein